MKAKDLLLTLNACPEAIAWVADKTIEEAWRTCPRGDWMLWIYLKRHPYNLKKLTLIKGHCANIIRNYMKDQRSINAIDTAIKFGEGLATVEELDEATTNAYFARFSSLDTGNKTNYYAALLAEMAVTLYKDPFTISDRITSIIYATAARTSIENANTMVELSQLEIASICRKYLTLEEIE